MRVSAQPKKHRGPSEEISWCGRLPMKCRQMSIMSPKSFLVVGSTLCVLIYNIRALIGCGED